VRADRGGQGAVGARARGTKARTKRCRNPRGARNGIRTNVSFVSVFERSTYHLARRREFAVRHATSGHSNTGGRREPARCCARWTAARAARAPHGRYNVRRVLYMSSSSVRSFPRGAAVRAGFRRSRPYGRGTTEKSERAAPIRDGAGSIGSVLRSAVPRRRRGRRPRIRQSGHIDNHSRFVFFAPRRCGAARVRGRGATTLITFPHLFHTAHAMDSATLLVVSSLPADPATIDHCTHSHFATALSVGVDSSVRRAHTHVRALTSHTLACPSASSRSLGSLSLSASSPQAWPSSPPPPETPPRPPRSAWPRAGGPPNRATRAKHEGATRSRTQHACAAEEAVTDDRLARELGLRPLVVTL
jgi:hypothetical protein